MITIRKSNERGRADHGWLDSRHTFSFADYYDPIQMGFRSLRVINEDRVAPGGGFPMHPHRDMEIFSYVLEGALAHTDSIGNTRTLRPGQVQLMSAGSGVLHSEFNPSQSESTHFLQIWIVPEANGLKPSYTEWEFKPDGDAASKMLVISRSGRDGSALIHQDADVWRLKLKNAGTITHALRSGRGAWLQVVRGTLALNGTVLDTGDGASVEEVGDLAIAAAQDNAEALLFDFA